MLSGYGAVSSLAYIYQGVTGWNELSPLQRTQLAGNLATSVVSIGMVAQAKRFGCFTAETEVQVPASEAAGVDYAALFLTTATLATEEKERRQPQRDEPNSDADDCPRSTGRRTGRHASTRRNREKVDVEFL